jgi:hypothetical protein
VTPPQKRILDLIASSVRERGRAPHLYELEQGVAWETGGPGSNITNIHRMVLLLARDGHLLRMSRRTSDMLLVDQASTLRRPIGWDEIYEAAARSEKAGSMLTTLPTETVLNWHIYTIGLERKVAAMSSEGSTDPVRNRWDGPCTGCGKLVERGVGAVVSIAGKWHVRHHECSGLTDAQIAALPEVGPKAPTEEERAARKARRS